MEKSETATKDVAAETKKCNNEVPKFERICGFKPADISSFDKLVELLHKPMDPSSLGFARLCFGFFMFADVPEERGGALIFHRFGKPKACYFPLFDFLQPPPAHYMGILYLFMWLGALGIMLGYKFKKSIIIFTIIYWYIILIDKTLWNNHSYLYGLIAILLIGSSADHYCSLDGYFNPEKQNRHVPLWTYFILRYQFFILYFVAGLKKFDMEWLEGYALETYGLHWVFAPFKLFLTEEQTDLLVIHWFGFIFDLTIGFFLLYYVTKPVALVFCSLFHLMNSRIFSIGMFPYVCLSMLPLYCDADWPKKLKCKIFRKSKITEASPSSSCIYKSTDKENKSGVRWKHRITVLLLLTHCGLQAFLPYSHFITKGYNNWTPGLYGYSWDMMIHTWESILTIVKVVDNDNGEEHFLDPFVWTDNSKWTKHADMCVQYAQCIKRNLIEDMRNGQNHRLTSENISIYIDIWTSLNERFQQRMYNPNYDLLKANWSPFKKVEWLLPLLTDYSKFRTRIKEIQKEVYSWSNHSDAIFIADFPGLYLENYVSDATANVTLTVLEGDVFYEVDLEQHGVKRTVARKLLTGDSIHVKEKHFHRVYVVSPFPACYTYTYFNATTEFNSTKKNTEEEEHSMKSPFPFIEATSERFERILYMLEDICKSIICFMFGIPPLDDYEEDEV